jgi:N-acetylmuramoyl-L-alanine amidase
MLRICSAVSIPLAFTVLGFAGPMDGQAAGPQRVQAIRFWSFGDVTRVAVQTEGEYKLSTDQVENPARAFFDLSGLRPPSAARRGMQTILVGDKRLKQIRIAEVSPGKTRIVFDLEGPAEVVSSQLVNPDRLMVEIRPKGSIVPGLSLARSVTASHQVVLPAAGSADLAAPGLSTANTAAVKGPSEKTSADPPAKARESSVVPESQVNRQPNPIIKAEPIGSPVGRTTLPTSAATSPARVTTVQTSDGLVVQQTAAAKPAPSRSPGAIAARADKVTSPPPKVVGLATPAAKDSSGDRSLVRVFGLKMGKVVIDPGHGGHDTGTIGPNGLLEKNLVLDVALRLGKLITQRLGAEAIYTRSGDAFLPLEARTKVANDERADLFVSIHANSSPEPTATGVETYFFNLTSDKAGLDLATRENATSGSSIADLSDLLHKAVLQTKVEESREFAGKVQASLWSSSLKLNSHSRDRGVRRAPFVVLIGATMPSILAEIGFVSNPHDEKLLQRPDQRQRIAEALFKGVSQYANSLSHVQIARASE